MFANDREAVEAFVALASSKTPELQEIFRFVPDIAKTQDPVLVLGETGTGKEMVARAIHACAAEGKNLPSVSVNCGGIQGSVAAAALFGHVKGSYTGAIGNGKGYFGEANGGTLFLDEIADLPPEGQSMLLRALDYSEIMPVGASAPSKVNVRIVAATSRDIEQAIRSGQFRQDLYYRLSVHEVTLPPLSRRHPDDILGIARDLVQKKQRTSASVPPKTLSDLSEQAILSYPWPGNVRELENRISRGYFRSRNEVIGPDDLGIPVGKPHPSTAEQALVDCRMFIQVLLDRASSRLTHEEAGKSGKGVLVSEFQLALHVCENDPERAARVLEIGEDNRAALKELWDLAMWPAGLRYVSGQNRKILLHGAHVPV